MKKVVYGFGVDDAIEVKTHVYNHTDQKDTVEVSLWEHGHKTNSIVVSTYSLKLALDEVIKHENDSTGCSND